jgi:hypothetical protein
MPYSLEYGNMTFTYPLYHKDNRQMVPSPPLKVYKLNDDGVTDTEIEWRNVVSGMIVRVQVTLL